MATTTPNYDWPIPEDTDLVKDGAKAIRDLGNAIDTTVDSLPSGALQHIETQTFTNVSGVSFNNVFTTAYRDYFIKYQTRGTSADGGVSFRLRAGGTDESSSVYNKNDVGAGGASVSAAVLTSQTSIAFVQANRRNQEGQFILFRPQTNTETNLLGTYVQTQLGGGAPYSAPHIFTISANHGNNYQADGFSLIFGAVNQDGIAMVYGYKD